MSGPKQSSVYVGKSKKAEIARQVGGYYVSHHARKKEEKKRKREEEERRKAKELSEAKLKLETAYKKRDQLVARVKKMPAEIIFASNHDIDGRTVMRLIGVQEELLEQIAGIGNWVGNIPGLIIKRAEEVEDQVIKLSTAFDESFLRDLAVLKKSIELHREMECSKEMLEFVYKSTDTLELSDEKMVSRREANHQEAFKIQEPEICFDEIDEIREEIESFLETEILLSDDKIELVRFMERLVKISESGYERPLDQMGKIKEEYWEKLARIKGNIRHLDEFYDDYLVFAEFLGAKSQGKESFENIDEIRGQIKAFEERMQMDAEAEYIKQSIQEVMQEIGYNVISSEKLTAANGMVEHSLYRFDEESAINAYVSENGSVMMEVACLGDDVEVLEVDRDETYKKMVYFCTVYPEIETKLNERGIFMRNKKNLPPNRAFVKKIKVENLDKEQKKQTTQKSTEKQPEKTNQNQAKSKKRAKNKQKIDRKG